MMPPDASLDTDQSRCFDEAGEEINCLDSGQDGALGANGPAAADRFEVTAHTARDRWTGLVWLKNANLPEFPLTWSEAFDFVREMNTSRPAGRSDWRLPTRRELFSIISHQCINPALPQKHPFENVFDGYYWTRTQCARLPDQAWYIHLGGAKVYRGMKHGSYMVWPVAGLAPEGGSSDSRFIPRGQALYDRLTAKTWFVGPKERDCAPLTWQQALMHIGMMNERNAAGYSDWRLPNIRELDSVIDLRRHSPALAHGASLLDIQEGYWSSTTSIYEPRYAWVLYTRDGAIGVGFKPQPDFFVLAVR